jgi:hypothetical protein
LDWDRTVPESGDGRNGKEDGYQEGSYKAIATEATFEELVEAMGKGIHPSKANRVLLGLTRGELVLFINCLELAIFELEATVKTRTEPQARAMGKLLGQFGLEPEALEYMQSFHADLMEVADTWMHADHSHDDE